MYNFNTKGSKSRYYNYLRLMECYHWNLLPMRLMECYHWNLQPDINGMLGQSVLMMWVASILLPGGALHSPLNYITCVIYTTYKWSIACTFRLHRMQYDPYLH